MPCGLMELAMLTTALSSVAAAGSSIAQATSQKDPELPPLPPNATDDEKNARKAALDARKRQRSGAQAADGRGSTILTGAKLGEIGQGNTQPKGLLGL